MSMETRSKAPAESTNGATAGQQDLDGGEVPKDPVPPVEEIRVDGTVQLGLFDAGGKKPTSSSIRLTGGKVLIVDGKAFKKGETVTFEGTAVVDFVAQQDKTDAKTGIQVSAEQLHRARITDLRIAGA
jgi:hypothetical protein